MNELLKKAIEKFEKENPKCEIMNMTLLESSHLNGMMMSASIKILYYETEKSLWDRVIETKKVEISVSIND